MKNTTSPDSINRRSFVKTAAAGAAAFVAPRFAIGQPGPSANSRLNIAMIGAGGIASMAYDGCKGENIVALCDVDSTVFGKTTQKRPELADAATFADFRVMLDKMGREIDAVCVSTPDHTHFAATMEAMQRGKHVCTQKPLTHNIWEARTLRKAKARYKVITNMGVQGHTYDGIRQMREWYEAGVFGQITEVRSWAPGPDWGNVFFQKPASLPPPAEPVPEGLDFDLWQGPTETTPFNSLYHPKRWRGFHRFGGGTLGDWFCHICDGPVWILDLYEPVAVEVEDIEGGNEWLVPDGVCVRWDFQARGDKKPCTFRWSNGPGRFKPAMPAPWTWDDQPLHGSLFFGEKTACFTDERSNHPRLANKEEMKAFKETGFPPEKYGRVKDGPFAEWVRAIKGEGPLPGADFDFSARLTEVSLLGCLAQRFGGRIEWDAANMRVTNRPELNAYLQEPARKGWSYGEDLWKAPGFLGRLMERFLGK